jgi:cell division transport system permease protein
MNTARPGSDARRRPGAIIPRIQPPLGTLMIAMTVMCYLATLAVGALVLVNRTVSGWTSELASEVTVQVRPAQGRDIEADVGRVRDILLATRGVKGIDVYDRARSAALLEPWLGTGAALDDLPIPRLVTVTIDRAAPPDFAALGAAIARQVPAASLDTHRRWQGELTRLAAAFQWIGIAILALTGAAAVLLVVNTTRAALDANRDIVEVLHLVGARDAFIARQVERRFLVTGLRAGLAGTLAGLGTFVAVAVFGGIGAPLDLAEASRGLVFGSGETSRLVYLVVALVPLIATLISLVTARFSVLRILREMS